MTAAQLTATGVSLAYDGREVVHDLSLAIRPGAITVIVGPNACGKSTLLRSLARLMKPSTGTVHLDGDLLHELPSKALARRLGLLPQQPIAPEGLTVAELVARGRHPHQGLMARSSAADAAAVTRALTATDTLEVADRPLEALSGGQRQRVWIAMALAQETEILLLDEPTTFLDLTHQVEVLDLLLDLNRQSGTTVVMVLHDLNLAARYADHIVVMRAGEIVTSGAPTDVITADTVRDAFGLESSITLDPVAGSPMVIPMGRFHRTQ